MARYRLKSAHYLAGDKHVLGDTELGEGKGTVVGDGTEYEVQWPTLEMEPLDEEAEQMIAKEQARIAANDGAMNPVDKLPMDSFEKDYVPGLNVRRREALPHGAPVRAEKKVVETDA